MGPLSVDRSSRDVAAPPAHADVRLRGARAGSGSGVAAAAPRRHWFASLVTLVVVLAVLAVLLRVLHLVIPIAYPQVLQGPFALAGLGEVEEVAGFSPLVPFFRPQTLGREPVHVTVFRRPVPRVVVVWQGERFLHLELRRGGEAPPVPPDAEPLPVTGGGRWWRHGRTRHVVARRDDFWVALSSDLDDRDVRRVVATLRPHRELL